MKLFNYYRNAAIYPSLFIIVFSISFAVIDNFRNEWDVVKSAIIMSVVTSVIFSLIMCLLSLPIFLNKLQKRNKKLVWNILTWFLLPLGYIITFLVYDVNVRIQFDFGFGRSFVFLLIMTVPFIVGLFSTFIRYRKDIRAQRISGIYSL